MKVHVRAGFESRKLGTVRITENERLDSRSVTRDFIDNQFNSHT